MNTTSNSPASDQQSGNMPQVTEADRKCAFNAKVQCRLINDASAVIAAHREQAVETALQLAAAGDSGIINHALAERDAAVQRAEAWKRVAADLKNEVGFQGVSAAGYSAEAAYDALAASEQEANREGGK